MYRRAIAICAAGVALAAVAQAAPRTYESWSVSVALKQPTATQLTADIKENSAGITLTQKVAGTPPSPTTTWTYASNPFSGASASYEVTARPGYDIKSVVLDGRTVAVAPAEKDLKTVSFDNTRLLHTLVVNTVAEKYSVSTSVAPARKGAFSPASMKNIAYGTEKTVKVVPMKGWQIGQVTLNGTPLANPINPDGTMTVSFQNNVGQQALAATFSQIHAVNAVISPVGDRSFDINKGSVSFELDAFRSTSNVTPVTYQWALTGATDATYATLSSTNTGRTVFTALKPGVYTVALTVSDGTVPSTKQVVFTAKQFTQTAAANCGRCHQGAYTEWVPGAHGSASGHNTGTCQRCHTTEGSRQGAATGWTGSYADVLSKNTYAAVTANSGIGCNACHNQHDGGRMLPINTLDANKTVVAWDPNQNGKNNDQYDVCTSCHSLTDNAGALVGNYHDGSSASVERTISDSHFDNSATGAGLATTTVEGYVLRAKGANACADCHNLHSADLTIQEQWAESGHAGKIKKQKEDALLAGCIAYYAVPNGVDPKTTLRPTSTRTYWEDYIRTTAPAANGTPSANATAKAAGVSATSGAAWEHYNWDQTTGTGNRATCQKCHTATGASNLLNNPTAYNPANNDFSHLSGWTAATGSPQNELLYCWGCHSDSQTGALRNPGAYTTGDYKFKGANVAFPDAGASNGCIACHSGQASGETITALSAAGNNFTNVSFVNSHYMAAAGLMYVKNGYTNFAPANTAANATDSYGQTLTSDADMTVKIDGTAIVGKLTSTHRKLGTTAIIGDHGITAADGLGAGGPCVACHMAATSKDHTWEIGQAAFDKVCVKCHSAEASDATTLAHFIEEEGAEPFQAALTLALNQLQAKYQISYNQAVYPYFYDLNVGPTAAVKDWTRGGALTAAEAEKLMGAAFNINLLKRDPAAHAHARTYARRLLYDTIDFLDDKTINMSTGTTAVLVDPVTYVKGATAAAPTTGAMKYLSGYNRTSLVWNAFERP